MSMAPRPFVFCRAYKHLGLVQANMSTKKYWLVLPLPIVLWSLFVSLFSLLETSSSSPRMRRSLPLSWAEFSTSLLPGGSSNALRCARWKAPIAILRALPMDVPVLTVFLLQGTAQMLSKVSQHPLQIAMAPARLQYLPRLLKVASTAPLSLLDSNRSWRDVLRHDCLSMWRQATFVNHVLQTSRRHDAPVLV